ncbi:MULTISPECIES: hypothetical protein [unclassified Francisella]|uniref:hypothetical protein n=1 Tax=unclassified Francisella TaxID=2610885 RepID=UPI002E30F053|nr:MULTISPECIES: hypothetical protein [unclassified Francisella]MED7818510.1 hypothetical protein [Francisella sp. 19S2-4]MED7829346.1 hypothetical protein [Francisella sp. 19S2-10]
MKEYISLNELLDLYKGEGLKKHDIIKLVELAKLTFYVKESCNYIKYTFIPRDISQSSFQQNHDLDHYIFELYDEVQLLDKRIDYHRMDYNDQMFLDEKEKIEKEIDELTSSQFSKKPLFWAKTSLSNEILLYDSDLYFRVDQTIIELSSLNFSLQKEIMQVYEKDNSFSQDDLIYGITDREIDELVQEFIENALDDILSIKYDELEEKYEEKIKEGYEPDKPVMPTLKDIGKTDIASWLSNEGKFRDLLTSPQGGKFNNKESAIIASYMKEKLGLPDKTSAKQELSSRLVRVSPNDYKHKTK